ncbi:MAG: WYL domain-containing protein, partial [Thiothrix sp.]|nr:WYL domain-containing protein [Thiothrix sp.]
MKDDSFEEKPLKRETYRRFVYLETSLYWGQGVTAKALGKVFGIARQNAQHSIEDYRTRHPDNMHYNPSAKRHEASAVFQPHYISLEPLRYLDYLRGNSLANHYWEDEDWGHLPVTDVDALFRPHLEQDIASQVVSAIQARQVLTIHYHAKFGGFEHLTISPGQLVYASRRYHVRAYCFERNRFIDLVLSRMLEARTVVHEDWISLAEDREWNRHVELVFMPNPALPEAMKKTL